MRNRWRKLWCAALAAAMLCGIVLPVAADGNVCFVSIRDSAASDGNDGRTPQTPKKNFGTLDGNGAVAAVRGGGTIVASGKLYVPETYTLPDVGGKLKITASYGGKNYMDTAHPSDPSSGVLKIYPAATFRLCGDVTFDDIIIFQEYAQSIIRVAAGATVTMGAGVECYKTKDYYMALEVEKGGTLILDGGLFSSITGEGTVIDNRSEDAKEISGNISPADGDLSAWKDNDTYVLPAPEPEMTPVISYGKTKDADGGSSEAPPPKDQTLPVLIGGCVILLAVAAVTFVALDEKGKQRREPKKEGSS